MKTTRRKFMRDIALTLIVGTTIVLVIVLLPWLMIATGQWLTPNPPKPKENYGEFPFKLVYEIDDQRVEIKDTLVVEYLGVGYNEGSGKYNKWKVYQKSSGKTGTSVEIVNEYVDGQGIVNIAFMMGSCEYYMGLAEGNGIYKFEQISPGDILLRTANDTRVITVEELYDKYNIKIIEKEVSMPLD
jgi:hypothetical protein